MDTFFGDGHGHSRCVKSAKARLFERAKSEGKRLGHNHQLVLDALLADHRAIGAYEIAGVVGEAGKRLQPVQVYRALETLIELGAVHRIESKNAFMACHNKGACASPQLLICSSCNRVAEMDDASISASIGKTAKRSGFVVQNEHVELVGLCPDCHSI